MFTDLTNHLHTFSKIRKLTERRFTGMGDKASTMWAEM